MRSDARSWAGALLAFASSAEMEEKRASALESAAMASYGSANAEAVRVARYLDDPGVDRKAKSEALAAMVPDDDPWSAFCELLVRTHSSRILPRIAKEYRGALDRKAGVERVLIESPRPLDERSRNEVAEAWKAIRKSERIIVSEVIIPGLLGGFRFSAGSTRYDVSIAGSLARLRAFLGQPLSRATAPGEGQQ